MRALRPGRRHEALALVEAAVRRDGGLPMRVASADEAELREMVIVLAQTGGWLLRALASCRRQPVDVVAGRLRDALSEPRGSS